MKFVLKSDKYRRVRGGYSRLLDLRCAHCGKHVCYYQKDGPGPLKRLYKDRIDEASSARQKAKLTCAGCREVLGIAYVYPKEQRAAFRLFAGAVMKKIIRS